MHEYPVTVRIVEIAEETAEKRKAKVRRIDLVVGKDSGFIGESIQMYFDIVAEGTRCEGAKLVIEGVEPRLRCTQCGELFVRRLYSFACPSCGGEGEPTAIGKEFYIKSMELETEEDIAKTEEDIAKTEEDIAEAEEANTTGTEETDTAGRKEINTTDTKKADATGGDA